jgi:hypothetical protein
MALTFEHDRDAFLAVLALVVGGDRQGSLRERDYLLEQVRPLPVFGDMSTTEFSKLLGEVTDKVYTGLPQENGAFAADGVETMLEQAKDVLGPELCETAVRSAAGLCAVDGSAGDEEGLLLQIRRVLV